MDIRPSRPQMRPPERTAAATPPAPLQEQPLTQQQAQPQLPLAPVQPAQVQEPPITPPVKKRRWKKWILIVLSSLVVLALAAVAAGYAWYQSQLAPANASSQGLIPVTIESGSSPARIATTLKQSGLIKNEQAFLLYIRIEGIRDQLLAGTYRLSPKDDTPTIADHLTKGQVDEFSLTFFPGATLTDTTAKQADQKTDVTTVLLRAGYSKAAIAEGLAATYDHPLFATKPAGADLEGYIYGETYQFTSGSTVQDIFTKIFDEFYAVVTANDLVAKYQAQGLTLYEGITLASIIQRESGGNDEAQIAQVFFSRRAMGMELGSDVTYQYIADKTGIARDTTIDSPYNTRRYPGLPPGPISAPGLRSLLAVAAPAPGDYLYFLSGDDDVTYYARTIAEHEANIQNHCQLKCQII